MWRKYLNIILLFYTSFNFVHARQKFDEDHHISSELLSWYPRINLYKQFLSEQECDFIIEYSKNHSNYNKDSMGDISIYFDHYPYLPEILKVIERRIGVIKI
jgi:hypothetical protein